MANGYFMISERNLKRKSFDDSSSDYNRYILTVKRYKSRYDEDTGTIVGDTLDKIFPKVIILDKGVYRAGDGETYDMRELNFPIRLHFYTMTPEGIKYNGDSYVIIENGTQYTIIPNLTFSYNPDYVNDSTGDMSGDELEVRILFEKREADANT